MPDFLLPPSRREVVLAVPAAAQGAEGGDGGAGGAGAGLRQLVGGGEQVAVGVAHLDQADRRRPDRPARPGRGRRSVGRSGAVRASACGSSWVRSVKASSTSSVARQHGGALGGQGLGVGPARLGDLGVDAAEVEQPPAAGPRRSGVRPPRPVNRRAGVDAVEAEQAGDRDLGIVVGDRRADAGVGGDQALFGGQRRRGGGAAGRPGRRRR